MPRHDVPAGPDNPAVHGCAIWTDRGEGPGASVAVPNEGGVPMLAFDVAAEAARNSGTGAPDRTGRAGGPARYPVVTG
jgi:hypothetical protein